jgi:hypothetical protein
MGISVTPASTVSRLHKLTSSSPGRSKLLTSATRKYVPCMIT